MRYSSEFKRRQFSFFNLVLLFIGFSGMIFFVTFDFFKAGVPNFGIDQLAGFIISLIIALAGLPKTGSRKSIIWDRLLLLVYLAGILFMGLRSGNNGFHGSSGMLQDFNISFPDIVINILGFVPLGYLMMLYFLSVDQTQKKIPAVFLNLATCIGISLLIELAQYYIPGRSSSLVDLSFNGLGALGGTVYCLLEQRYSRNN